MQTRNTLTLERLADSCLENLHSAHGTERARLLAKASMLWHEAHPPAISTIEICECEYTVGDAIFIWVYKSDASNDHLAFTLDEISPDGTLVLMDRTCDPQFWSYDEGAEVWRSALGEEAWCVYVG
jgi:hypothetical protein